MRLGTSARRRRGILVTVVLCAAGVLCQLPSSPVAATGGRYVALGDSYTAGPLIPNQLADPAGCLRSDRNYPHVVAASLGLTLSDRSCSGAETEDMTRSQGVTPGPNPPQFDALTAGTDIVTLGIGGNDIGFSSIIQDCVALVPWVPVCKPKYVVNGVDEISARIAATASRVAAVLQGIHERSPDARVYVVGYPAILPEVGGGCWPSLPLANEDVPWLRSKEVELNAMLAAQAAANDAFFVDTYSSSIGHDACKAPGVRWVEPIIPAGLQAAPVHPNALGEAGMAAVVSARIVATTPTNGTISGTVTEAGSGAPVAGAFLAVLRTNDFSIAGGAVADGTGNYSAEVPAGSYSVYVIDPSGAHTAGFFGSPTMVNVTAGDTVDADPQMASRRGSITATVTEMGSGDPVGGVWGLALSASVANTGATEAVVVADGSGRLTLPGLGAGSHFVGFVDPTGAHATRFFPSSPNVPESTPVAVTAGDATAANASMPVQTVVPGGLAISGTVVEQGTGAPLERAHVVALRASDFGMVRGAVTDSSGQYSLDVAAGEYKLAILDSAGLHAMEWYDDQASTGLGSAASVSPPVVADAALAPSTGSMSGTVTDDPSGDAIAGAWVIAIGSTGIAGGAVTAADGSYTISGLPPGTYRATFVDPYGGRSQEYWHNSPDYPGAAPFAITAGATAAVDAALALL